MKLSELFKTPFKVKGGGVLNLRGFSKSVVDKEVGEGGGENENNLITTLYNRLGIPEINQQYVASEDAATDYKLISLNEVILKGEYYTLIKKSDFDAMTIGTKDVCNAIVFENINSRVVPSYMTKDSLSVIKKEYIIDGETYIVADFR